MADILTQSEIDQLWQALNAGLDTTVLEPTQTKERIRPYDFRSANRIPREQIRTLGLIYEQYARLAATYLTGAMGVFCDVAQVTVEEQKFYEFTNSVMPGSLLVLMKMDPLPGSVLFCIAPDIAYAIVENLLGGAGSHSQNRRAFTEIDLVILEKVVRHLLSLVDDAWEKVIHIETVLESLETSLQFAQIVPPNEAIAIVTLQIKVGDVESFVNFCIPQAALEPFGERLNAQKLVAGYRETPDEAATFSDDILTRIIKSTVPLKGILAKTTLTIRDITQLQKGDVIFLDHPTHQPVGVEIGHIPRLEGVLGIHNKRYAIKVTEITFEEGLIHE